MPDLDGSGFAYKLAKKYYESIDVKITDYTIGGKLEVFDKKNINELYKK